MDDRRITPGPRTLAVHAGEPSPRIEGSIAMPIFQSATYAMEGEVDYDDIRYIRLNNTPNHEALSHKLAALTGAEDAVVGPSGTAAISATLLSLLQAGDHVLASDRLYGGTRKILAFLEQEFGIGVSYVPLHDAAAWEASATPRTRLLYVESLTNPLLELGPLDEVARLAKARGWVSVIDNTVLSPMNFQPLRMGYDLVLHSASKYLNGHSDLCAGVVAGAREQVKAIRHHMGLTGACLDPHACVLLHRGLKTLPLRVPVQNENARVLAEALEVHPQVSRVFYPGLPSDPGHARAQRWFDGYGALLAFTVRGDKAAAEQVLERLQLAAIAPSFGGLETLACRPAATSHAGLSSEVREGMGVTEDLLRVSLGIEDSADIVADFVRALR